MLTTAYDRAWTMNQRRVGGWSRQAAMSIALVLNASCTHQGNTSLDEVVEAGDCEGEAAKIAQGDSTATDLVSGVKKVGGTAASYGAVAAGYTADVVVTGTVGIVAITVFCPVFIAEIAACAASKGHCRSFGNVGCFANPFGHDPASKAKHDGPALGPGLGSKALTGTESWREDSRALALVRNMRTVAACYQHRGTREDLIKASLQLQQVHESHLYDRIATQERDLVNRDIERVKTRLNTIDPHYQEELDRKNRELAKAVLAQQAPTLWRDRETGSMWRFQPATVKDGNQAQIVCDGAAATAKQLWQVPSRADAVRAIKHGIADPEKNAAFAEARAYHGQAFIRDGDSKFAVIDLATGEIDGNSDARNISLLCVQ